MDIERFVSVFNKSGDDKIVEELNADMLDLELLKKIFTPAPDDPMFYKPYKIEEVQYKELINHLPELEEYPCDLFDCYLEAETI